MGRYRAFPVAALLFAALVGPAVAQRGEGFEVVFLVNDATEKDRVLAGATVQVMRDGEELVRGETGSDGRFSATLEPGVYRVSYGLRGYVPVVDTEVEVRGDGQVVTTTLSRMLEAALPGSAPMVRIILNWGSDSDQARDVDSHLFAGSFEPPGHVYFGAKEARSGAQEIDLDVDDVDWGGPETVTLKNLEPGTYLYWVYNYSGEAPLGAADVVVRVLFEDAVQAEYRVPLDVGERSWRPMKALEVGPDLRPRLVDWNDAERASGLDRATPSSDGAPVQGGTSAADGREAWRGCVWILLVLVFLPACILFLVGRFRRRR